jgi:hypothetical protein
MELTQAEKDLIFTIFFSHVSVNSVCEVEVRSIVDKFKADGAIARNVSFHKNVHGHIQIDFFN